MRIVAGAYRGRPLVAPKGHSTRPTADRTRQALYNVLAHAPWAPPLQGARILDLYAGSGALGFEALSRGAAFCLFVDRDAAARVAIATNLASLGCEEAAEIANLDAGTLGGRGPAAAFDIAFLDPPYGEDLAEKALGMLKAGGWLAPGAVAVVERAAGQPPLQAAGYKRLDDRAWGAARLTFLQA